MMSTTSSRRNSLICCVRRVMADLRVEGSWSRGVEEKVRSSRLLDFSPSRLRASYLFTVEELDLIADLEIVEAVQTEATLVACRHFADVVLEALEGLHRPLVDHGAAAQHPGAAVAGDPAVEHVESGDHVAARQLEGFAHFRVAIGHVLEDWRQETGHGRLHLVQQVVDDVVEADID